MSIYQLFIWSFFISALSSELVASKEHPYVIEVDQNVQIEAPERPLKPGSLVVVTSEPKNYLQWSDSDISISFQLLQKIARSWNESGTSENYLTNQYLVYGGQIFRDTTPDPFHWEIVPYYQSSLGALGSFTQQIDVLKAIVFGGRKASEQSREKTQNYYRETLASHSTTQEIFEDAIGNDPFCNPERILRQRVLEGTRVNVLFNYAPIGFGDERLHFLIIPKGHKKNFSELSQEEYQETIQLSQLLMAHFGLNRTVHDVHLFHKTGVTAGQTVPHWHMHMVFILSETQALMGKLTVLKNMLFGSSPMGEEDLRNRVRELIEEFNSDQSLSPYLVPVS